MRRGQNRNLLARILKLLASSISSCIYRLLFKSSTRKMIHWTKLFTTTLKSYICLKFCEDWGDAAMPSIPVLCSLREHQQKVCIMLSRFWQFSRDGGWSEFKTVKRKICNKDLFPENFAGSSKKLISAESGIFPSIFLRLVNGSRNYSIHLFFGLDTYRHA